MKEARTAFEKAVKLRPNFAGARIGLAYSLLLLRKPRNAEEEAVYALTIDPQNVEARYVIGAARLQASDSEGALEEANAALKIDPQFAPAYSLITQALLATVSAQPFMSSSEPADVRNQQLREQNQRLREAADNLEKFLQLSPNTANAASWREQLDTLRAHSKSPDATNDEHMVFSIADVTTKAVLFHKPEPGFTESARRNEVSGTVKLRLVLAADGTIKHILVLRSLSHGLTEKAITAARSIRFTPAIKDGRYVSQLAVIEYSFNVY